MAEKEPTDTPSPSPVAAAFAWALPGPVAFAGGCRVGFVPAWGRGPGRCRL